MPCPKSCRQVTGRFQSSASIPGVAVASRAAPLPSVIASRQPVEHGAAAHMAGRARLASERDGKGHAFNRLAFACTGRRANKERIHRTNRLTDAVTASCNGGQNQATKGDCAPRAGKIARLRLCNGARAPLASAPAWPRRSRCRRQASRTRREGHATVGRYANAGKVWRGPSRRSLAA